MGGYTVMAQHKAIQHSKEVLGGTPVFFGTRVPVTTLIDYLEGGDTISDFLEDFPTVKKKQVVEILEEAKANLMVHHHARVARRMPAQKTQK